MLFKSVFARVDVLFCFSGILFQILDARYERLFFRDWFFATAGLNTSFVYKRTQVIETFKGHSANTFFESVIYG